MVRTGYGLADPLITLQNLNINDPAMDPNYAFYKSRVNATNAGRYQSYLKAMKAHDIGDLADKMDYENTIADIDQYIKYAKQDYIAGLAKVDANMADALQQATENYGAQNLIGSGIQAARTTEMINDADAQKEGLKQEKKNTMDKYNNLRNQAISKYEQVTKPINEMNTPKYRPMGLASRETFAQAPGEFLPNF